jgi:hypothetical protein
MDLAGDEEVAVAVAGKRGRRIGAQRFALDKRLLAVVHRAGVAAPAFVAVGVGAVADEQAEIDVGGLGVAVGGDAAGREAGLFVDADDLVAQVGFGVGGLGGRRRGVLAAPPPPPPLASPGTARGVGVGVRPRQFNQLRVADPRAADQRGA